MKGNPMMRFVPLVLATLASAAVAMPNSAAAQTTADRSVEPTVVKGVKLAG
jgi:hypothetical protein